MPGTLFIVSTPIGNLEDITLRALRVLKEADLIAAEDTRHTRKLLNHYGIATPALSFHAHNERTRIPQMLQRLAAGAQIALVTDAGTPGVSDPGAALVAAAREVGISIVVIPGASAVLAAVSLSGLPLTEFTFVGFPPSGSNDRIRWFTALAAEPRPIVLFEAPHRIAATLQTIHEVLGDRMVTVGRELTKAHEELVIGPISQVSQRTDWIGELTILVMPDADTEIAAEPPDAGRLLAEFREAADAGLSRREAVGRLARRYGVGNRAIYAAIEEARKADRPAP